MKKCVDALEKAGGDVEEAVTILRKAGVAAAGKKAGRDASEGAAAVYHGPAGAAIVEINSETDFVARNEIFQKLCADVARTALGLAPAASDAGKVAIENDALGAAPLDGSAASVTESLGVAVSQLGENLVLRRAVVLPTPAEGGVVATYVHNAYAPGVGRTASSVVLASTASDTDALKALGQKLAMHVVAASPLFVGKGDVDSAALDRERDILVEQAKASGKPEAAIEKMVSGRINKYYNEVCLLEQTYLVDTSSGGRRQGPRVLERRGGGPAARPAPVELKAFARFAVGESA